MEHPRFPELQHESIAVTRDAYHAWATLLGDWLKALRPRRKHWWHSSLRPSIAGLTTGVIRTDVDIELHLNMRNCTLEVQAADCSTGLELRGQSVDEVSVWLGDVLAEAGVNTPLKPERRDDREFGAFSREQSVRIQAAFASVAASLARFRAGIREETSPIQVWPHHFDLSMLWLPGDKIPDQDPGNEELADKQMNFGFVLGDAGIPAPYLYITAYPQPAGLADTDVPGSAAWHSDGFSGVVLDYAELAAMASADDYLQALWGELLGAGRRLLVGVD